MAFLQSGQEDSAILDRIIMSPWWWLLDNPVSWLLGSWLLDCHVFSFPCDNSRALPSVAQHSTYCDATSCLPTSISLPAPFPVKSISSGDALWVVWASSICCYSSAAVAVIIGSFVGFAVFSTTNYFYLVVSFVIITVEDNERSGKCGSLLQINSDRVAFAFAFALDRALAILSL